MIEPMNEGLPQAGGVEPKKAVSGPIPYRNKQGGLLLTGTGNQKRSESRFKIAKALVEAGNNPTNAMRKAGYSESTARQSSGKYPVKQELIKVRDTFMMKYVKKLNKLKLDGASTAERLSKAVHGKDDFAAIQAIKTHVMILLKNAPTEQQGGIFGVFVVPGGQIAQSWQSQASTIKAIQVKSMIQDAETGEAA